MSDERNLDFLLELEKVIEARRADAPSDSYTAKLFAAGPSRIAQKVGEEGVEVALSSVQGNAEDVLCEASDLIYHLIVLLKSHDLSLRDVAGELRARHR